MERAKGFREKPDAHPATGRGLGSWPLLGLTGLKPFPGRLHVCLADCAEPRKVKYSLSIPAEWLPASVSESATWWPAPGSSVD